MNCSNRTDRKVHQETCIDWKELNRSGGRKTRIGYLPTHSKFTKLLYKRKLAAELYPKYTMLL